MEAKKISVLNNSFNVKTTVKEDAPIIQIGKDASENSPTKVFGATVKGNEISTNVSRIGIDTVNGGVGVSLYIIENNSLSNVKLNLKANDLNVKNQLLNKN